MNDRQSKHGYKLIWRNITIPNNITIPIDAETYKMSFLELNVICKKRPVFENSTCPTCNEPCNNERRWVHHWNGQMVHTHTYKNISLLYILFKRELQNYNHIFFGDRGNISLEFWLTVKKQGRYPQRVWWHDSST